MIHILQCERQALEAELSKEREERGVLEGLNKELKKRLKTLENDDQHNHLELQAKTQQLALLTDRVKELTDNNSHLNQQLAETRTVLNQTMKTGQDRLDYLMRLERNVEHLHSERQEDEETQRAMHDQIAQMRIDLHHQTKQTDLQRRHHEHTISELQI